VWTVVRRVDGRDLGGTAKNRKCVCEDFLIFLTAFEQDPCFAGLSGCGKIIAGGGGLALPPKQGRRISVFENNSQSVIVLFSNALDTPRRTT
jgi:hypothetical protein